MRAGSFSQADVINTPADFTFLYVIVNIGDMSTMPISRLFTTQEAAAEIGVTDAYIRQLIGKQEIRAERAGKRMWLISADEVERFKQREKKGGRPRISADRT